MTTGGNPAAVVGEESSLSGRFVGQDLTVLGHFDGELRARGVVRIGPRAGVKAQIEASAVEVEGTFEGEIRAGRLLFGATARARGVFLSDRLTVKDGAVVEGAVNRPPVPVAAQPVVEPVVETAEQDAAEPANSVAPAETAPESTGGEAATEAPVEPSEGPYQASSADFASSIPAPATFAEAGLMATPPTWQPHQRRRHRRRRHM